MLNKIIKWLPFFLLYVPFKLFALISNKKKNILLFGTGTGLYHDNSKYLFEYFLENQDKYPELKGYWVATNKKAYVELSAQGIPVVYRNSVLCSKYAVRAKAFFITSGLLDVFWFIDKNTLLIQLWHGVPIKKIGFDTPVDVKRLSIAKKYFNKNYQFERYDYLIIEDERYEKIFRSAFQIEDNKILGLGQPRNIIFNEKNSIKVDQIKKKLKVDTFNKIILYAPTFRDNKRSNLQILKKLLTIDTENYLLTNNYCLMVKLHPFLASDSEIKSFLDKCNSSVMNIVDIVDIQELLIISDAVITDISSLALDYLEYSSNLYKFFPDEEDYINVRGDFYEITYVELENNSETIESVKEINFDCHQFKTYAKENVCKDILHLIQQEKNLK